LRSKLYFQMIGPWEAFGGSEGAAGMSMVVLGGG